MRHTAITRLVEAGVDLPTVQRISGHKTLAMVLRYAHVHDPHIDDAVRAIGRTLPQRPGNAITQKLHMPQNNHPRYRAAAGRNCTLSEGLAQWRPEAESNRCTRICSPLHSHSAIRPAGVI
jgi:hypothetical protein